MDAALLAALAMGSVPRSFGAGTSQLAAPVMPTAAAILLWQAFGLAGGLAAVGTLVSLGLPGDHLGVAGSLLHLGAVFSGAAFRFPVAFGMVRALPAMLLVFLADLPGGGAGPARLAVLGAYRREVDGGPAGPARRRAPCWPCWPT